MRKWDTIGTKLVLAFTFTTLLLTVVSVVAWTTWGQLDQQVSNLLDTSVPKYNTSYLLERQSSEIRSRLQPLSTSTNKVELKRQISNISKQLVAINQTLSRSQSSNLYQSDVRELKGLYNKLEQTINQYSALVVERIHQRRKIRKLIEQINWLHQDIRSELVSLRQEFYWLLTRDESVQQYQGALDQLRVIQSVIDLEANVFSLTTHAIQAKQLEQIQNAQKVIQFNFAELVANSEPLVGLPSGISYQQLLDELALLHSNDGMFFRQLSDNVVLNQRIDKLKGQIEGQLGDIHQQIGMVVKFADASFRDVKSQTASQVSYGNRILVVCFSLSIALSLFVTYYFIKRRIVARLSTLSSSIDAIIKGDFTHRIVVDGKDEIGRLSHKLIEYGSRVKELQRTNAVSLINNTSASLLTCDLAGYVESANLSARKLLAMQGSVEDKLIWQSFHNQGRSKLAKVFVSGQALFRYGKDSLTLAIDGEFPCYLHFDFHLFSHGQLHKVIVTITDVTQQELTARELEKRVAEKTVDLIEKNRRLSQEIIEREKAELTLKQAQEELIQAAKMAVVGQAMTSLAHELNQPLNAMSTYLYSAKLSYESGHISAAKQSLEQVETLSARMSEIISNLRSFSKKSDTDQVTSNLPLAEVTQQAIAIVGPKAKRQMIEIENHVAKHLHVHANGLALEQVLVNLLVNGCDSIAEANSKRRVLSINHLFSNSTHHAIGAFDSGGGFDHLIVAKLFTPFTTTKEVGLGLGLSISSSLIEKYDGQIYLASGLDKGALVVLEILHAKE